MKNLESFGVQEMNAREISETDGGFIPILVTFAVMGPIVGAFALGAYNGYNSAAQ